MKDKVKNLAKNISNSYICASATHYTYKEGDPWLVVSLDYGMDTEANKQTVAKTIKDLTRIKAWIDTTIEGLKEIKHEDN